MLGPHRGVSSLNAARGARSAHAATRHPPTAITESPFATAATFATPSAIAAFTSTIAATLAAPVVPTSALTAATVCTVRVELPF